MILKQVCAILNKQYNLAHSNTRSLKLIDKCSYMYGMCLRFHLILSFTEDEKCFLHT